MPSADYAIQLSDMVCPNCENEMTIILSWKHRMDGWIQLNCSCTTLNDELAVSETTQQ